MTVSTELFSCCLVAALVVASCTGIPTSPVAESIEAGPHEPLQIRRGKVLAVSEGQKQPIESVSEYCFSCHGQEDPDQVGQRGFKHSIADTSSNHPVDVTYPQGENARYKPLSELDARLLLLDGQITCLTCHDAGSRKHALVISDGEAQLCTACHNR
jgi:predicted CXXCH cytochrome family protein